MLRARMCRAGLQLLLLSFLAVACVSCGYSEEQWKAQLDKYNRLVGEKQSTQRKLDDVNTRCSEGSSEGRQIAMFASQFLETKPREYE